MGSEMTMLGLGGMLCVGGVLGPRMLQLYLQLPLVYPQLSSLGRLRSLFSES